MSRPRMKEGHIKAEDIENGPNQRVTNALMNQNFPMSLRDVADNEETVISVNRAWRTRLTHAQQLDFVELENVFYAAGEKGASFEDICRYFGLKAKNYANFEELKTAHQTGVSALRMKLRHTQIHEALTKKNPLMLIWVSKNFGGMGDDGQTSLNIDENGNGSLGIFPSAVRVQANRDSTGTTLGPTFEMPLSTTDDEASPTRK